jgi:hypothetical protein
VYDSPYEELHDTIFSPLSVLRKDEVVIETLERDHFFDLHRPHGTLDRHHATTERDLQLSSSVRITSSYQSTSRNPRFEHHITCSFLGRCPSQVIRQTETFMRRVVSERLTYILLDRLSRSKQHHIRTPALRRRAFDRAVSESLSCVIVSSISTNYVVHLTLITRVRKRLTDIK